MIKRRFVAYVVRSLYLDLRQPPVYAIEAEGTGREEVVFESDMDVRPGTRVTVTVEESET